MRTLRKEFKFRGFVYKQAKRCEKAAIYKQFLGNTLVGLEVITVNVLPPYEMNGVRIEGGESYPGDSAFGRIAWSVPVIGDEDKALREAELIYKSILNKDDMGKNKIITSSDEVVNDSVRLKQEDFVELYVDFGYTKSEAMAAYQTARSSKKGQLLSGKLGLHLGLKKKEEVKLTTSLSCGDQVEFLTKGGLKFSGEVVKVFLGSDGKEYVRAKRGDGKLACKQVVMVSKKNKKI